MRKHLGQPCGTCDVRRAQEGRLRSRVIPAPALGITERQQQLTALRSSRHAARAERRERHLVQPDRLLVREQSDRARRRAPGVADRLVTGSARGGLEEVMRELGEVGVELGFVEDLQRLAHPAVQLYPATSRHAVVRGVPDQGVSEAQAPDRSRNLCDHARFHRLVEQLQDGAALEPADMGQRIELELAAEHRRQREQPVASVREMPQPAADRLSDAVRDHQRRGRRIPEPPLFGEQPHDLADESGLPSVSP